MPLNPSRHVRATSGGRTKDTCSGMKTVMQLPCQCHSCLCAQESNVLSGAIPSLSVLRQLEGIWLRDNQLTGCVYWLPVVSLPLTHPIQLWTSPALPQVPSR